MSLAPALITQFAVFVALLSLGRAVACGQINLCLSSIGLRPYLASLCSKELFRPLPELPLSFGCERL